MKTVYITTMMLTALLMLILPLSGKKIEVKEKTSEVISTEIQEESEEIRLLITKTGEVEKLKVEDYLFGVVAAEMPALYNDEALKAQAVVAYTYYLNKKEQSGADYDITDDFTKDQAFITRSDARSKWGDQADEYENKIKSAVKSVLYKKITYDGRPILAVYHAISSGKTENVSDLWGGEYPYLVSVDSSWDSEAKNFETTVTLSFDEVARKLASKVTLTDKENNCFTDPKKTENGSVKTILVGGTTLSGADVRTALELRSANFDVAFEGGNYTFTVRGYGHGIGMSQNGANYLAGQNKTYEEIINHYYTGCKIE